jgi:hypothetical protein
MIVALVFTTTPTEVQAQTYTPVFYYYHGDHLGSSNVMTDRNGALVQHFEYAAFGNERFNDNTAAVDISNRYTGHVSKVFEAVLLGQKVVQAECSPGKFPAYPSAAPGCVSVPGSSLMIGASIAALLSRVARATTPARCGNLARNSCSF